MNTTLLKGILKYIGIILGILLGVAIILVAIMYFSPNFRLFGYGYMHRNKTSEIKTISTNDDITIGEDLNLTINSGGFDIVVTAVNQEDVSYFYKDNVSGFIKTDYNPYVSKEIKDNNIILTVVEPKGSLKYGSSEINLSLPMEKFTECNLILKTNSGDITLDGLKISNMDITCGGKFNLSNIKGIEETNELETPETQPETSETSDSTPANKVIFNSLNFDSKKRGVYDFTSIENLTINNTLTISGSGEFQFKNLNSDLIARGNDISIRASNLTTNSKGLEILTTSGKISIDKLTSTGNGQNTIFTENSNITIGELKDITTLTSNYGDVKITNSYNQLIIDSGEGDVTVATAHENIIIKTTLGNINVNDYKKSGSFTSDKGNIIVKSTSTFIEGYVTNIQNSNGFVDLDNNENKVNIKIKGKGDVKVIFRNNINKDFTNTIDVNTNSTANIYISQNGRFKLKAVGKVSGEIGSLTNIVSSTSYVSFPPNYESLDDSEEWCKYEVYGGTVKFNTFRV